MAKLIESLLFHFFFSVGTLAEHLRQLTGIARSESTLSERRQALRWDFFAQFLRQVLRPLAQPNLHASAFWRSWRLVAWDGTQFSLTNTPQIKNKTRKARARRQRSAWAKITAVVLLELGLHNPLAAAIGWQGQSEYFLTQQLAGLLPAQALLLADRLTGCPSMLFALYGVALSVGSHFLVRVRKNLKVKHLRRLADGSRLGLVEVHDPRPFRDVLTPFVLREIQVQASRRGRRPERVRLWTTLLDPLEAPALELAKLYTQRWEQELYFRQMKLELRKTEILQSHTLETAAQEVAMLLLATSLLARERTRAAAGQLPVLSISFVKCLELLRPLWLILTLAGHLLTPSMRTEVSNVIYSEIRRCLKPKRRHRSCTRAVRQPIKGWPRLLQTKYTQGQWKYRIV